MRINKRRFFDYFLIILFIGMSGVPYFYSSILYIPLFLILLSAFIYRKRGVDKMFIYFIFFLLVITGLQTYRFNFFSIQTSLGVFLPVINSYLIVKILGRKFIPYYINIFYVIAITSLVIYLPMLIFPVIGQVLLNFVPLFEIFNFSEFELELPTIIIYNLTHIETFRNTGPFWEPGLYVGYLFLAFVFNSLSINSRQKKISIILIITIVTTLSTTGYIALFTFLIFLYYGKVKNKILRLVVVFILLFLSYFAFINLDFLGPKIEEQLEVAIGVDPYVDDTDSQRFLSIARDVEDFKGYEIIGRGSNPITRYSYDLENQTRTVGFTDVLVRMGGIFFILMLVFMYQSIKSVLIYYQKYQISICIGIFLCILITLMSEIYFQFQLYWSLLFLKFVYKTNKISNLKEINES